MVDVISERGTGVPTSEQYILLSEYDAKPELSSLEWVRNQQQLVEKAGTRPLSCMQNPGDIIFVPGGWLHMTLNIDDNVAWTQNLIQPKPAHVATSAQAIRTYAKHRMQSPRDLKARGLLHDCAQKLEAAWGAHQASGDKKEL